MNARNDHVGAKAFSPEVLDVQHGKVHYNPQTYCAHPRQGVFGYYGGGELVVGHFHAPCNYAQRSDVQHGFEGYKGRAVMLLQRSLDGGRTWPSQHDVVVYDETMSFERKREMLFAPSAARPRYDMFSRDSLFFFGRTWLPGAEGKLEIVCFALRSPDRGRTWERTPTIVRHPNGRLAGVRKDCHPVVPLDDGKTLLAAMTIDNPSGPAVYASEDNGLSWHFRSRAAIPPGGVGTMSYVGLLMLAGGQLACFFLHINEQDPRVDGCHNAICMARSSDLGRTWGPPEPIVQGNAACWAAPGDAGMQYRSPWPVLLADGRIVVIFARRRKPYGIGGVVSDDGGRTWSGEFVLRDDAVVHDLGYPVAGQLDDGRIFTAYYHNKGGPEYEKAVRYIASTTFRLGGGRR